MVKYEYKIDCRELQTIELELAWLNELGSFGWQLCNIVYLKGSFFYYFKRKRDEDVIHNNAG